MHSYQEVLEKLHNYVPAEKIPKIIVLLEILEKYKNNIIIKDGRVSFRLVVKRMMKEDKELYNMILEIYGCEDETCLSRSLSTTLKSYIFMFVQDQTRLKNFQNTRVVKAGAIYELWEKELGFSLREER